MTDTDGTAPASEETMAALGSELARMRNWQLWLLEMAPNANWPDLSAGFPEHFASTLLAHLKWLERLEQDGTLVLSGPVDLDAGLGPGLSVIRAGSREEAEALVADEPFSLAGYRDNTVRSWTVNEGSITVRVNLMANQIEV
ncbi:MAG: YciI family protein [Acidimicrobiaceae bacterium]|nr:YciI family protein [Acidimicrobiaceae bacterium]